MLTTSSEDDCDSERGIDGRRHRSRGEDSDSDLFSRRRALITSVMDDVRGTTGSVASPPTLPLDGFGVG